VAVAVIADSPSAVIAALVAQYNLLQADVTALRTLVSAHVHGGITAGGANSSAIAAAAALTSTTITVGK
jgi:hypothetical protein